MLPLRISTKCPFFCTFLWALHVIFKSATNQEANFLGTFLFSRKTIHGNKNVFCSPYDWVRQFIHDVTEDVFSKLKKKINCPGARFLFFSKSFRTQKAIAKYRSLWLELFSHILTINRSSLNTSSFRRIVHFYVSRYRWTCKKLFYEPEKSPGLSRNGRQGFNVCPGVLRKMDNLTNWGQFFMRLSCY